MPTALSVFSGVGGFDLAARAIGLDARLATDIDNNALQVLHAALGTTVLLGDIKSLLINGALSAAWPGQARPDIVFGGAPCTAFSHAGFWLDDKRNGKDPAADLLSSFAEIVEVFGPRAFVLENVPGLAFKTHRSSLDAFRQRMTKAGFNLTANVLSAAAFAVPQRRRRLFVVGVRGMAVPDLSNWPTFPTRTAGSAIGDLAEKNDAEPDERLTGPYGDLLSRIPAGGNYLHFTERYGCYPPLFKNRGRYWSFLLKIDPNQPAPTVPAQRVTYNGPFHWSSRHLRVREIARLQGFPDSYPVAPSVGLARRQLGNAVPPALAAAVLWRTMVAIDLADSALPPPLAVGLDPDSSYPEMLESAFMHRR